MGDSGMNERSIVERIARLIEPHEFLRWQQIYEHARQTGATEQAAHAAADHWHGVSIERARGKASEILLATEDLTPAMVAAGREALQAGGSARELWIAMIEAALRESQS